MCAAAGSTPIPPPPRVTAALWVPTKRADSSSAAGRPWMSIQKATTRAALSACATAARSATASRSETFRRAATPAALSEDPSTAEMSMKTAMRQAWSPARQKADTASSAATSRTAHSSMTSLRVSGIAITIRRLTRRQATTARPVLRFPACRRRTSARSSAQAGVKTKKTTAAFRI